MHSFGYFLTAYLIGAIPTGSIAAYLGGKESLFPPGERTPHRAGDVFKILGRPLGLLVTILDILKGCIAVWPLIDFMLGPEERFTWWVVGFGGLLAVIGHCHSIFLGFRGGRGTATSFGVLVSLLPGPAILACFLGGSLAFWGLSTRPGVISAAGAMPLFSIPWVLWVQPERINYLFVVVFLTLWTFYEHWESLAGYMGLRVCPPPPPAIVPSEKLETPPSDPK
ncbi:MAG: glycerol-3-phosphate acyltransferase [Candidatus Ozemobacteraceae bacterium]